MLITQVERKSRRRTISVEMEALGFVSLGLNGPCENGRYFITKTEFFYYICFLPYVQLLLGRVMVYNRKRVLFLYLCVYIASLE